MIRPTESGVHWIQVACTERGPAHGSQILDNLMETSSRQSMANSSFGARVSKRQADLHRSGSPVLAASGLHAVHAA